MSRKVIWVLAGLCWVGPLGAGPRIDRDSRSKGLLWGWGHSWGSGWPGWGKTKSDLGFVAFHPQMGWFVTDRLELYGEGTLLVYHRPELDVSAGLTAFCGRYHLWNHRLWLPYGTLGAGLIWTSLDVTEIDRVFNFQVVWGAGVRILRDRGPGWIIEFRNHHISNAGTAGRNLGINAATILAGIEWLR
ncbi:MAG: hypothetical protein Kow001_23380 [Acidobacteriota bacterium]